MEYATEEEAAVAANTHKNKKLNDEKLFVIRAMGVRKDKYGEQPNNEKTFLLWI